MDPIILAPGEGDGDEERSTKLSTDELGVVEFHVEKDDVGDHIHECDEIFYVLEGRMTFRADGRSYDVDAGGFVFIPSGSRHGFEHSSRAHYLVISSPGGLEKYFAETEEAEANGAREEELEQIAARYGTTSVD
ncbi:MAG: cupin domain-containing protein [Actinobacteria bacterium]|nr:MAG: cupin domain-containing protein [Actinomycetota bacterium]